MIEVSGEYTFTAVGKVILKWKRFSIVGRFDSGHDAIRCLLVMGSYLLSASADGFLCVWNWESESLVRAINLGASFDPSALAHPPTYLNKVVIGSTSGALELWNVRTGARIARFRELGAAVTFLEPSPAADVLAVGLSDGRIELRNLRVDEVGVSFFPINRRRWWRSGRARR